MLWHCWLGGRKGIRPVKNGGWWTWALVSPDGVGTSRMVCVSACVNLSLHHKVQKFSSGTGSPGWSRKKGRKTVVVCSLLSAMVDLSKGAEHPIYASVGAWHPLPFTAVSMYSICQLVLWHRRWPGTTEPVLQWLGEEGHQPTTAVYIQRCFTAVLHVSAGLQAVSSDRYVHVYHISVFRID